MTGWGTRSISMWVHRNLFWRLSRDGYFHGSGMSHAKIASPKPSFKAHRKVGDAVVGRRNAVWTISKTGHPCPCQNCSQWPLAENTGTDSQLNRPPCLPNDPIGQGTELNRTEPVFHITLILQTQRRLPWICL